MPHSYDMQHEGEALALEIAECENLGFVATLQAAAERLDGLLTYAQEWDRFSASICMRQAEGGPQ